MTFRVFQDAVLKMWRTKKILLDIAVIEEGRRGGGVSGEWQL
jgi:hypothetical protein